MSNKRAKISIYKTCWYKTILRARDGNLSTSSLSKARDSLDVNIFSYAWLSVELLLLKYIISIIIYLIKIILYKRFIYLHLYCFLIALVDGPKFLNFLIICLVAQREGFWFLHIDWPACSWYTLIIFSKDIKQV